MCQIVIAGLVLTAERQVWFNRIMGRTYNPDYNNIEEVLAKIENWATLIAPTKPQETTCAKSPEPHHP